MNGSIFAWDLNINEMGEQLPWLDCDDFLE